MIRENGKWSFWSSFSWGCLFPYTAQTEIIQRHFITDCFQEDKAAQKCIVCGLTQKSHFAFYLLTRKRWE